MKVTNKIKINLLLPHYRVGTQVLWCTHAGIESNKNVEASESEHEALVSSVIDKLKIFLTIFSGISWELIRGKLIIIKATYSDIDTYSISGYA